MNDEEELARLEADQDRETKWGGTLQIIAAVCVFAIVLGIVALFIWRNLWWPS